MKNQGRLHVELLNYSADGELTAALAAKLCYSDSDIDGLREKVSRNDQEKFIKMIVEIGHHSVLEHVSFTFGVEGVSRALTHQLVRHRVASYSQKSQRYVKHEGGFEFILPPTVAQNDEASAEYARVMEILAESYDKLAALGIPAEDARYVLPNACETKIIITMNARQLIHFFAIRCCNRAQWEIREMATEMLKQAFAVAPSIFAESGPGCVSGPCPEGRFTCGKAGEVRKAFQELKNTEH